MALVVTEEWEHETKRILEAESDFDVLGLVPHRVTVEDVRQAYDATKKRLITRDSVRNPTVQRARHRLDKAHAALGDATLLERTLERIRREREEQVVDAGIMEAIRQRTRELESRAEVYLNNCEALKLAEEQKLGAQHPG